MSRAATSTTKGGGNKYEYQKQRHRHPSSAMSAVVSPVHMLVSAALEAWCHQLLYVRRVYPKESFCDTYFLDIQCKANRHPGVASYIQNAIEVSTPALVGPDNRVADEISLEVIDCQHTLSSSSSSYEPEQQETKTPSGKRKADPFLPSSSSSTSPAIQQLHVTHQQHQQRTPSSSTSERYDTNTQSSKKHKYLSCQQPEEEVGSTQQSVSSMSTTELLQQKHQQQYPEDDKNNRGTTLKSNSFSLTPTIHDSVEHNGINQDEQKHDTNTPEQPQAIYQKPLLQPKVFKVLEKFSLSFSSTLKNAREDNVINSRVDENRSTTDNHQKRPKLPSLFQKKSNRRSSASSNKAEAARQKEEDDNDALLKELERSFRNLLLNLQSLKRDRVPASEGLCFKLVLHVDNGQKICPQIQNAFEVGSWYPCSCETTGAVAEDRDTMFHYEANVQDCAIRFYIQYRPPD